MINLDDPTLATKTPSGPAVLTSIDAFPKQLEQAWNEASITQIPAEYKNVTSIVACGMGGSRFTPLIVKELFKKELRLPMVINDNYELPGFVNQNTLVLLSSYSGTTEEVLACGEKAKAKGAKIIGLCMGGPIAQFLEENKYPRYIFNPTHNPSGQPRIGVGYMTAGNMGLVYAAGLLNINKTEIESAVQNITELTSAFKMDVPTTQNPAKQLAQKLFDKYPYYITAEHLQGVGNAIANQTNETAKSISSYRFIPELNHHLMEGLQFPKVLKDLGIFVFFTSSLNDERVQKRFAITKEVVEKNGLGTEVVELKGKTKIEQVFELIAFGSYLTMYLSMLYEQDPAQIPWVNYFKEKLKS